MTFKEIIPRLAGQEREAGLVIVQAVLETRLERAREYKAVRVQSYRNSECQKVLRSLERLAEQRGSVPDVAALIREYGESRLNGYREIVRIDYLYDAMKCLYQSLKGEDASRLEAAAGFTGEVVFAAPMQMPEADEDEEETQIRYQWERETERQEYVRILGQARRSLRNRTGRIFERE